MRRRYEREMDRERKWIERLWRKLPGEKYKGTSKVIVCLVAARWMFVEAQCIRGEER